MKLSDELMSELIGDLIVKSFIDGEPVPDFYCDNCDALLPKDDWTLSQEDNAAVARINCPDCGVPHEVSIS